MVTTPPPHPPPPPGPPSSSPNREMENRVVKMTISPKHMSYTGETWRPLRREMACLGILEKKALEGLLVKGIKRESCEK